MEYIKKEELKEGEIYTHTNGNIVKYETLNSFNKVCGIHIGGNKNNLNYNNGNFTIKELKLATSEEKHWLNECIKLDKFITFEEAMKTFIPEYVECVANSGSISFTVGKIYTFPNPVFNTGLESRVKLLNGSIWRFKPSTKEAYDAQFVVKEPEFVLPEKWCVTTTVESSEIIQKWRDLNGSGPNRSKEIGIITTVDKHYIRGWIPSATSRKTGYKEITFEQFKKYVLKEETAIEEIIEEPVIENKTEMEIWLENTKSLNLSLIGLINYIGSGETCNFTNIFTKLEGRYSEDKAKILFSKWNNQTIEPLPQFKVIETIETITKVENNEGNQFFIGDLIKSDLGHFCIITGFEYNSDKSDILTTTTINVKFNINRIEHYVEPEVKVKDEFILPEKWCIKQNSQIINDWLNINKQSSSHYNSINQYQIIHFPAINGAHLYSNIQNDYTEITFDQFKKYVLKEEELSPIQLANIEHPELAIVEESLLDKAKRLYPIGTKFKSAYSEQIFTIKNHIQEYSNPTSIVFGTNELNNGNSYYGCVCYGDKWAEIINSHYFKIGDKIKISTLPQGGSQPEYLNNNYTINKIEGNQLFFETGSIPKINSVLAKNAIKVN